MVRRIFDEEHWHNEVMESMKENQNKQRKVVYATSQGYTRCNCPNYYNAFDWVLALRWFIRLIFRDEDGKGCIFFQFPIF